MGETTGALSLISVPLHFLLLPLLLLLRLMGVVWEQDYQDSDRSYRAHVSWMDEPGEPRPPQIDFATVDCEDLAFLQRKYDTSVTMWCNYGIPVTCCVLIAPLMSYLL